MTIQIDYEAEQFQPLPGTGNEYVFTFEYLEEDDVEVYWNFDGTLQKLISPTQYSVTLNGPLLDRKHQGGTVTIYVEAPAETTTVVIARHTDINQLVNYQPNGPFEADVTEFTIDKLTMICQELLDDINFILITGGGGGGGGIGEAPIDGNTYGRQNATWVQITGGGGGDFVPLAGTTSGDPITGTLHFAASGGAQYLMYNSDALASSQLIFQPAPSANGMGVSIQTKNDVGDTFDFVFNKEGIFAISSKTANNDEFWQFGVDELFGDPATLLLQSYDYADINNPVQTFRRMGISNADNGGAYVFNTNGRMTVPIQPLASDDDLTVATIKYVEDAIGGAGGLPPGADHDMLFFDNTSAAWATTGARGLKYDWDDVSQGVMSLQGTLALLDPANPADSWSLGVGDISGTNAFLLIGNAAGSNSFVVSPGGGNNFSIAQNGVEIDMDVDMNGTLEVASDISTFTNIAAGGNVTGLVLISNQQVQIGSANPTAVNHATRKDYVDAQVATKQDASNAVTLNTSQTITGTKTFNAANTNVQTLNADVAIGCTGAVTSFTLESTLGGITSAGQVNIGSASPVNSNHATRKDYVDAAFAALRSELIGLGVMVAP